MPNPTLSAPAIAKDPGFLFHAPLGSTAPTNTVAGGVFTDAWPAAWVVLGATDSGHTFNYQLSADPIQVAEFLDPIAFADTGRAMSIAFALASIHAHNFRRSMNAGSSALVTTGSAATSMTTLTPPGLGASVRCMIGWESQDSTERLIAYQCYNTGQLAVQRQKGADKATLPLEFNLEVPSTGLPFQQFFAGTARLGA